MKKLFKFDIILEEEEMCNRATEKRRLLAIMEKRGRIVIYSPRRMGKTTLATVCGLTFKSLHPQAFLLYVDLNEISSLAELANRFRSHYESAIKEQFPVQKAKILFSALLSRIKIGLPGGATLALEKCAEENPEQYLMSLFAEIKTLSASRSVILIIDEFQGIADLKSAQALLRREFQQMPKATIILMGSNQRLLYRMLNDKKLPFFGFGEDMELTAIPLKDYLPYMSERFAESNLHISEETALHMIEKANGIPNYINELGAWIVDSFSGLELTTEHIDIALDAAATSKHGRYESALYGYTNNQKQFLMAIAKLKRGTPETGKEMQTTTSLSPTELARVKHSLEDCPLLSRDTQNHFFIIDPFLKKFLEMM